MVAPNVMDSGTYLEDDEVRKMRRALALSLLNKGSESGPVGHWTQALARGLQGTFGGYQAGLGIAEGRAREEATAKLLGGLFAPQGGGVPGQGSASMLPDKLPEAVAAPELPAQPAVDPKSWGISSPQDAMAALPREQPRIDVPAMPNPLSNFDAGGQFMGNKQPLPVTVGRPMPDDNTAGGAVYNQPQPALPGGYGAGVKQFEGFTPKSQWDYAQHSSGYGTRAQPGEVIDRDTAETRFQSETSQARAVVDRIAPNAPEGVKAALTSLTFNAGPGWTRAGLGQQVQAGDWQGAAQTLQQYNKAGGQVLPGLQARRATEAQWMGGAQPQAAATSVRSAAPTRVAQAQTGAAPVMSDAVGMPTRDQIRGLLMNPGTRAMGLQLYRDMLANRGQGFEMKTLKEGETPVIFDKRTGTYRAVPGVGGGQVPEHVTRNIMGGLNELATIPDRYGGDKGPFASAVGGLQGDESSLLNNPMGPIARAVGSLTAPSLKTEDGKKVNVPPAEVRRAIDGATNTLSAVLKPLIRKPGEGTWSDADQARLDTIVGSLKQANSKEQYMRELGNVRSRIRANFGIDLPEISGGAPAGRAESAPGAQPGPGGWGIRKLD